jgi:pimeloyl-ACP methyl ester carboxylesterase
MKGTSTTVKLSDDLAAFERARLELFARHGFDGESRWVTDRRGRRTYLIGRGLGPRPTVLVHGGLSEASEWSPVAGLLPGDVLIPDRPGCGLSHRIDYRKVADFRQAAVDWMRDLTDALGTDRVDLVANSMGGYFAIVFALAHPERVRRLVLAGAPAGVHQTVPLFLRLWANPVLGPLVSHVKIRDPEVFRTRIFARLLVANAERVPRDLLEVVTAATAIPGAGRAAHTMLRSVANRHGLRPAMILTDEMAALRTPTLFLWGDADVFASPSIGRELARRMPRASFRLLPDAGHLPYVDRPDAVAAAITEFLQA